MMVLLKQRSQDITEDAVKEIARRFNREIMVLLVQRGQDVSITEDV